jgi:hypothetical protein
MKAKFGAWVLPAEGVKIPNSRMVKVEGAEQVMAFLFKAGRAEERTDRVRMRRVMVNMITLVEEYLNLVW